MALSGAEPGCPEREPSAMLPVPPAALASGRAERQSGPRRLRARSRRRYGVAGSLVVAPNNSIAAR